MILLNIIFLTSFGETSKDLNIDLNIITPLTIWEESSMEFGKLMLESKGPFFARAVLKAEGEKNRYFRVSVPKNVILKNSSGDSYINVIIEKNSGEGILNEDITGNLGKRSIAFEGRIDTLTDEPGVYKTTVPVVLFYD